MSLFALVGLSRAVDIFFLILQNIWLWFIIVLLNLKPSCCNFQPFDQDCMASINAPSTASLESAL